MFIWRERSETTGKKAYIGRWESLISIFLSLVNSKLFSNCASKENRLNAKGFSKIPSPFKFYVTKVFNILKILVKSSQAATTDKLKTETFFIKKTYEKKDRVVSFLMILWRNIGIKRDLASYLLTCWVHKKVTPTVTAIVV